MQAIELLRQHGAGDVSVGMLADRLGLDPSTASRLVAGAIDAAYVRRAPAGDDGRRVCLDLTPQGEALARDARAYQRAVFLEAVRSFSAAERRQFARLFVEFADRVIEAHTRAHPPGRSRPAPPAPKDHPAADTARRAKRRPAP